MTAANIAEPLQSLAVPINTLRMLPGNPRRGDIDAIARSYAQFGQRKPVIALRDGTVIAGNHQFQAALKLGWVELAVVYVDDDEATAKAFALADNRTSELGAFDSDMLRALIADVSSDPELLAATSYDLAALLDSVGDEPVPNFAPVDPETQPRLDQRKAIMCPECAFEWRVGPRGEIEPV